MDTPVIRLERDGNIGMAIFNRPERLNPLSIEFQQAFRAVMADVRNDRSLSALVITGEGKGFCVGADLSAMKEPAGAGSSIGQSTADTMHELTNRLVTDLRELPIPVVAAVNGACAGAGVGLALAADVVIAARSSYFYLPFMTKLGIVPDVGCTWFLEHLAGRARATALTLLGDRLHAEQAQAWGLVWACVDDSTLRHEALVLARRLAKLPAHAALETRRAYDAAAVNSLEAQLAYEAERQRELLDKPTFAEGVRAFLDKREPRFEAL